MGTTIKDQIKKLFNKCFNFEFDLKNSGITRIRTPIKKIEVKIISNSIF